jgi:adenosine 3'-phospho 5'-phosphosulfate transporter B3
VQECPSDADVQATSNETCSEAGFSAYSDQITLFSINVSRMSGSQRVCFIVGGIFLWYIITGGLQEYMFYSLPGFHFGLFTTFVQYLIYSFASVIMNRSNVASLYAPRSVNALILLVLLSAFSVSGIALANVSLGYVTYPTKVMFKSCKLLAVMLFSVVVYRRKFAALEYVAAMLLTAGLATMSLDKAAFNGSAQQSSSFIGVALLLISLVFDAAVGNLQERLLNVYGVPATSCIIFQSVVGSMLMFFATLSSGELQSALAFCADQWLTIVVLLAYGTVGYVGVRWYLTAVRCFGVVSAQCIATVRKMLTILVSFLLFPKPFSVRYLSAMAFVMCGIAVHVYAKSKRAAGSVHKRTGKESIDNV